MSEWIEVAQVLGHWPVVEGFFIIVITFLGVATYRRGERDRQRLGSGAVEIPLFLLNGPVADAMQSAHNISEQSRETNQLLRELIHEVRNQNGMIEWIGNQAGIAPPPRKTRG